MNILNYIYRTIKQTLKAYFQECITIYDFSFRIQYRPESLTEYGIWPFIIIFFLHNRIIIGNKSCHERPGCRCVWIKRLDCIKETFF